MPTFPLSGSSIYCEHMVIDANSSRCRLSNVKSESVFSPDWPFAHHYMIKQGALGVFEDLQGLFKSTFKEPCVVFAGQSVF